MLLLSRINSKYSINIKNQSNVKAHAAILAAGCASSSPKIHEAKQKQFFRKAGGKVWYDPTMEQWSNG